MQRKHEGCSARRRTAASRRAGSGWRPATQTFPGLRAEVRLLREVAGLSQHLASEVVEESGEKEGGARARTGGAEGGRGREAEEAKRGRGRTAKDAKEGEEGEAERKKGKK